MYRIHASGRRGLSVIVVLALLQAATIPSAASAGLLERYSRQLLAKAVPDECFNGIGVAYPPGPPCATGQPKVNQAYVWGLAKVGSKVWFGTGANVHCIVGGATLGYARPRVNADAVCEYGQSQIAKANPQMPPAVGDQRQPRVYFYDTAARQLVDKSAEILSRSPDDAFRLKSTLGLRAGGAHRGVVLLAGPSLGQAVTMFAFDGNTGQYLGSAVFPAYGNIRHFHIAGAGLLSDGELYAGVGVGRNGDSGGHVLRWTGDRSNPFRFIVVANLPTQAADLTDYNGRLYVSTWPNVNATTPSQMGAIWMSPLLLSGAPGLDESDAAGWSQVWNAGEYEPDPTIATTYGMGGLAAYGGYLYWGTMHVPMKSTSVFMTRYPQTGEPAINEAIGNTQRATSVFRGLLLDTPLKQIELLYGEAQLPTYDPAGNGGTGSWSPAPTGYNPRYGESGFGNPYNNYEWIMTVAAGKLFVGTMDWSYLAKDLLPPGSPYIDPAEHGGELWVFESSLLPAQPVDRHGLGNYLNYGVRNIIADGSTLYIGMANPMNLRTNLSDSVPEGGWELIKMDAR